MRKFVQGSCDCVCTCACITIIGLFIAKCPSKVLYLDAFYFLEQQDYNGRHNRLFIRYTKKLSETQNT